MPGTRTWWARKHRTPLGGGCGVAPGRAVDIGGATFALGRLLPHPRLPSRIGWQRGAITDVSRRRQFEITLPPISSKTHTILVDQHATSRFHHGQAQTRDWRTLASDGRSAHRPSRTFSAAATVPKLRAVRRPLALLAVLAGAVAPSVASAATTAQDVRIGEHPAFVRVVVDFAGGTVADNEVEAIDPRPLDGLARLRVTQPGIRTIAAVRRDEGVRVRVVQETGRLRIGIRAAADRFKYVSYMALPGGRLAIDLWKAAPPSSVSVTRYGPAGCLTLDDVTVADGVVRASGRERDLFEHGLVAVVRGRSGRVLARRPVTAANGRWSARLVYAVAHRQAGTFEAFAASAKDGSLVCLAQSRVVLPASPGGSSS
jgi:hypothetical protein